MIRTKTLLTPLILVMVTALALVGCGGDKSTSAPCFTINVASSGMGTAEFSPDSACYHSGTMVSVTCVPNEGWAFDGWSGDFTSTDNPVTVTVNGNVSLTMNFSELYSITAQIDPPQGGSIALTPDQQYFEPGDTVYVEAMPAQFHGFSHWIYTADVRNENPTMIIFGQADETIDVYFGVLEGEPACADEYVDYYNGGCNYTPNTFLPVIPGQLMLAQGGHFTYQGSDYRDTDWFEYVGTDSTAFTYRAVGEFDLQIYLVDGAAGCSGYSLIGDSYAAANDTALIEMTVGPGTYWLWAGTADFTGWPCPQDYKFWFTVAPALANSVPATGRPPREGELSNEKW